MKTKKNQIKLLFSVLILVSMVQGSAWAQSASECFGSGLQKGAKLTLEVRGADDKIASYVKYEILSNDGSVIDIETSALNADKSLIDKGNQSFFIKDNSFYFSPSFEANVASLSAEGVYDYPCDLQAGMKLKDFVLKMKNKSEGTTVNSTTKVTKRVVEAVESVTTAAGVFECYKISYTTETKVGIIKVKMNNIEWISKEIGIVKSEMYYSGQLSAKTILSEYTAQ